MGPEGGNRGGLVVAEGTPEDVAANPDSYTGQFLRPMLEAGPAKQPPKKRARKAPGQTAARRTAAARTRASA
jgi:excinuclease ABC subunit A